MGRAVLLVYRVTQQAKYYKAAKFLHEQLALQPRTASGAYWHKQIYPNQMWLDGAYMAEPFRAAYAVTFQEPGDFDDIAKQLLLMDEHMRDAKTGLMKHGWDESKQRCRGRIRRRGCRRRCGRGRWGGMRWRWWMCWIGFRRTIRSGRR